MSILKKNWILFLVILVVVALVLFNLPKLQAWRLSSKAAEQMKNYVNFLETSSPDSIEGLFYCLLPLFHEGVRPPIVLDEVIQWLNRARLLDPNNVHSSFLLGQAYCLKQEYSKAIDALDGFLTQRPDNLLAKAEAGFAAIALAKSASDSQSKEIYLSNGLQSLQEAGYFDANTFLEYADFSIKHEKNQDALVWYGLSDSLSGLQGSALFRYALLQLIFQGSSTYPDQIKGGMTLELDRNISLEPTSFFELSTGSAFQTGINNGYAIVTLAHNEMHAGVLLNVMETNRFCFSLLALDKPPQPTQIDVDLDFKTFATTELVNGDDDWVHFNFDVNLDQGFHVLAVKLMNDLYVEGVIDRNAYIGPITIKACQSE